MDEDQDFIAALASVGDDFTDVEVRETALQVLEAGDGLEVVVAIGRDDRFSLRCRRRGRWGRKRVGWSRRRMG